MNEPRESDDMSRQIEKRIEAAFAGLGVNLIAPIDLAAQRKMPKGVTNRFLKVKATDGRQFLVRLNGRLWSPFSRQSEAYNLKSLKQSSVESGVLFNSPATGIQICRLSTQPSLAEQVPSLAMLFSLGYTLRWVHTRCQFKGRYPVCDTLNQSYQRLAAWQRDQLSPYFHVAIALLGILARDRLNMVASHNDLLPSSVYPERRGMTLVDWEYSAENHMSYDIALYSIQSKLNAKEESMLVQGYHAKHRLDLSYYLQLAKPAVRFLLATWALARGQDLALMPIHAEMQMAIFVQSAKALCLEYSLAAGGMLLAGKSAGAVGAGAASIADDGRERTTRLGC